METQQRRRVSDSSWQTVPCAWCCYTGNTQSPRVEWRLDGTKSVGDAADRRQRRRRAATSVLKWRDSARYDGAVPWRHRYARTHNRNLILSGTLSQRSSWSSGVLCSLFLAEKINRAAAFRTDCSRSDTLTNHSSSQKTRLNNLRTLQKSGQIFLQFCHNPRVWQTDRQTEGWTDRILIARLRLHSMQCSEKSWADLQVDPTCDIFELSHVLPVSVVGYYHYRCVHYSQHTVYTVCLSAH